MKITLVLFEYVTLAAVLPLLCIVILWLIGVNNQTDETLTLVLGKIMIIYGCIMPVWSLLFIIKIFKSLE